MTCTHTDLATLTAQVTRLQGVLAKVEAEVEELVTLGRSAGHDNDRPLSVLQRHWQIPECGKEPRQAQGGPIMTTDEAREAWRASLPASTFHWMHAEVLADNYITALEADLTAAKDALRNIELELLSGADEPEDAYLSHNGNCDDCGIIWRNCYLLSEHFGIEDSLEARNARRAALDSGEGK